MATPAIPKYLDFITAFNPQAQLSVSQPDFMREIGYESTGGYPIEQAPWMAGPPVPDFMTPITNLSWDTNTLPIKNYIKPIHLSLGQIDWNNPPNPTQSPVGWRIADIERNPNTGLYWLRNVDWERVPKKENKMAEASAFSNLGSQYYSIGQFDVNSLLPVDTSTILNTAADIQQAQSAFQQFLPGQQAQPQAAVKPTFSSSAPNPVKSQSSSSMGTVALLGGLAVLAIGGYLFLKK